MLQELPKHYVILNPLDGRCHSSCLSEENKSDFSPSDSAQKLIFVQNVDDSHNLNRPESVDQIYGEKGLIFHGSCIKNEIEALHNTVLFKKENTITAKVHVFEDNDMSQAMQQVVKRRQKAR